MRAALALLLVVLCATPVSAQQTKQVVSDEPVSVTIALMGVVLSAAGFAMMLRQDEEGESDTGWLVGGVVVVGAGVTLTYLGLKHRTVVVTIKPTLGPRTKGATASVTWKRR